MIPCQPVQECGPEEDGEQGDNGVPETDVQDEVVIELQRTITELTRQLERSKVYYRETKRQSSLQIQKLAQQKLISQRPSESA